MKKMRKLMSITILLLGLSMVSCSIFPIGKNDDSNTPETDQPQVISAGKNLTEPENSPAVMAAPTKTLIPSITLSPTPRLTWTPFPTKTLRPSWTPTATLSPTPTKDIGWIVKDDFSVISPSWYQGSGSNWEIGFARGGYYLSVEEGNVEINSNQSWLKLDDVRVIFDVYRQNGKGYWGISCRESGASSYYTIFITSEGQYGYGETRNSKVDLTILNTSSEIFTGRQEVNQFIGECRGNFLTLFVNGMMLFRKEVTGLSSGWVGMMAGTQYGQDHVTVFFDNIEIWGPIEESGD
jgi:hypothetical protein